MLFFMATAAGLMILNNHIRPALASAVGRKA